MESILNEIRYLRGSSDLVIDRSNSNKYRVLALEKDGSKTAYCFSVPIYNEKTRKLIDLSFHNDNGVCKYHGSSSDITFQNDEIFMVNDSGKCTVKLSKSIASFSPKEILYGDCKIYPTTNGLLVKAYINKSNKFGITISCKNQFDEIRSNDRCFSIMEERFKPFVTVSVIGVSNCDNTISVPAQLIYEKINLTDYHLEFVSSTTHGRYVLFEINLHEAKLFQDTTVESMNPTVNNAFGSVAFIGSTDVYGEQWLYSRADFDKISEMLYAKVNKAVMHIPKFSKDNVLLSAHKVATRFCSFGSTWENRKQSAEEITDSRFNEKYHSINLLDIVTDPHENRLVRADGIILKSKKKTDSFSSVATGDSFAKPQILEINYN